VRFNARLTRTGVFDYGDHKELRVPEEVFKKEALDSFRGLTVTVGHRAWLDASNWKTHAIGHVGDDVKQDGNTVVASLIVKDQAALAKIDAGDLVEISMGYSVDLDESPGVTPTGEKYDSIQRNIFGNHAALGPVNWGRAGSSVRLLDGAAYADDMSTPEKRIDAPSAQNEDAIRKDLDAARADADAIRKERDTARTERDAANKRADVAEAERDTARKDATEAKAAAEKVKTDAAATADAKIQARIELLDAARGILGTDFKPTKKEGEKTVPMSDKDVRVAALAKVDPDLKLDGKSDDYVTARFDLVCESVKGERKELGAVNESTVKPAGAQPTKSVLDAAHEKAEAERRHAAQAGPPVGAMVRK
jgi:hypothetical protein